jgi:aspartate kinase
MSLGRPDVVVMKFGGTSVEDAAAMSRTAAIVKGGATVG